MTGMAIPTRRYRGVSAQQRHLERRERLLDAGLDLLGTEGWAKTTVTAVCARAKLTERYFYQSFPSREHLLVAVFDRIAGEAAEVVLAAVAAAPHDARARARAAIAAYVELVTDDPRKGRVTLLEALGCEALETRRRQTLHTFAQLVAVQARSFYGPSVASRRDVELTAHFLVGGLAELLIAWLQGGLEISRDQLVDHCAALFVAAAQIPGG
jgi:AcrR family transcriptional regulator